MLHLRTVASVIITGFVWSARAEEPHAQAALGHLRVARAELQLASLDERGVAALRLVTDAITQLERAASGSQPTNPYAGVKGRAGNASIFAKIDEENRRAGKLQIPTRDAHIDEVLNRSKSQRSGRADGAVGIKLTLPVVPLSIQIDQRGRISLSSEGGRVPTPIGTFSLTADVSIANRKTLTVTVGDRRHVYDLGRDTFRVAICNARDGTNIVEYDGSGNIVVIASSTGPIPR